MNTIIKINDLTKSYGSLNALVNVNLELEKGKIIGLLGPNGSGKTTLIKVLTGLLKQYSGTIYIDGQLKSNKSKALISYLPDQLFFDSWMKIKDLRNYYKDMYTDFDNDRFQELLRKFKIEDRIYIKKLSKGNQEKLQLALVLSRRAKIYIFDEPIGGVDPALRQIILDTIMNEHEPDSTVLLSTHQIYDVESLFDEVIFLKEGRVLLHKPINELIELSGMSLLETFKEVFKYA
ncbi:MAG: ABC transporter ATP-binding protein [Tenericutes bacterium]|nr:ABC transporter ATP-binding protein [Mycoplasmatota bacterium]